MERLPLRDLATLSSEDAFFLGLAEARGATPAELGYRLWASELTTLRARALIEAAQGEIAREIAEKEAKRKQRKPGRRR
jgi:hypothetical protein